MTFLHIAGDKNQELEDYRTALKSPEMRRIFRRLLRESMFFSNGYYSDVTAMAHNEGLRRMGAYIVNKLESAQAGALAGLMAEGTRDFEHMNKKDG